MNTPAPVSGAPLRMRPAAHARPWHQPLRWAAAALLVTTLGSGTAAFSADRNSVSGSTLVALAPNGASDADPSTVLTNTEAEAPAAPAAAPAPPPPPTLILNADLSTQRVTVTENGVLKHTWLISSGRAGFATQTGTFRPQWASRLWHSRQYEMAPMPHAVFFNKGAAFHATTAVRMLGRPASHGCLRLSPTNAEALFKMVHKHGYARTKIIVHNGTKNKPVPVASKADAKRTAKAAQPTPRTVAAKPAKAQPDLRSRTSAREATSRLR